ncbi:MAG: Hsp20/alpha crystallin family protein [Opitutaceae bacterium]
MITTISRVENTNEFTLPSGREHARPHHDITADEQGVEISAIMPEVSDEGLELILFQDQMIVTGRRTRTVRPNWEALQLECVQKDYRLCVRLGFTAEPESIRAELACGILSIRIDRPRVAA